MDRQLMNTHLHDDLSVELIVEIELLCDRATL